MFDELGITNLTVLEETGKNLVLRKLAAQEADKLGVIGRNLNRIGIYKRGKVTAFGACAVQYIT